MVTRCRRTTPGCDVERVHALWVVALVSELTPLLAVLRRPRLKSHRLCVGDVAGRRIALLRAGVGPDAAERRTRSALDVVHPNEVWSIGSCGALADDLAVGDLLTAHTVRSPAGHLFETTPVDGIPSTTVHTVRRPVFTANHRAAVASTGAAACEMEASGVVRAADHRVPVRVLKVVSDQAGAAPDPAIDSHKAIAMAHFHVRVERLMRTRVAPTLVARLAHT